MKNLLKYIARLAGVHLVSDYDFKRQKLYKKLLEQLMLSDSDNNESNSKASLIIFSKDRALQLEALLRSYFSCVANIIPTTVLYHASNTSFEEGYQKLITEYSTKEIEFVSESNFRNDLQLIVENVETGKILFMVDDLFFKEEVDLDEFLKIDPKKNVGSLRLGKHLNYAYTVQQNQRLPEFILDKTHLNMLSWSWEEGEYDWAYPLSVDGHLFNTKEMKVLVDELEYKAPNSFEAALQIMQPLFAKRRGLCYSKSVIINNPCNKVQTEHGNFHGETSISELNTKWLSGERIDIAAYKGFENKSVHQDLPLKFLKDGQ